MDWNKLRAPMPREYVKWRAQSVTRDGAKALALAYVDARAVMIRLDDACGPSNWQDTYSETARGRVICSLSIKVGGDWVTKSDGAGDSDVEGEKGGISDAFKRAGVKWGIGRELYALPSPWVPCEVDQRNKWRKWKADPWDFIRTPASKVVGAPAPVDHNAIGGVQDPEEIARVVGQIKAITEVQQLEAGWRRTAQALRRVPEIDAAYQERRQALEEAA